MNVDMGGIANQINKGVFLLYSNGNFIPQKLVARVIKIP